jgi:cation diffusion facilitator family transporter
MVDLLGKKFIKDYKNYKSQKVRTAYGKLASIVGIICNVLLFVAKIVVGSLSNSVSITADAINNLSDSASGIISLVSFKMAGKPADEEHPYGHGRIEYLAGLTVSVVIMVIGVELFKGAIKKIITPSPTQFSWVFVFVLILSILVKLLMMFFYGKTGRKINSKTLEAASIDSRNDAVTTSSVLLGTLISKYLGIDLDGYFGLAVSVFVLYIGFSLIRETLNPLLGEAPDPILVEEIKEKILSYDKVLGTHDLIVHDYGPGRVFASVHVEMDAKDDPVASHEILDRIEKDFLMNDKIHITVHYDPILKDDSETGEIRSFIEENIKSIDERLEIHDLRIVPGEESKNVIFDCVVPHDINMTDSQLKKAIDTMIKSKFPDYNSVITLDSSFAAMPTNE